MASVRCRKHVPHSRLNPYCKTVDPIGYPDGALICSKTGCDEPGLLYLNKQEVEQFSSGVRTFFIGGTRTRVRAKKYVDLTAFNYGVIVVETYRQKGEASSRPIRVRPVREEGFSPDVHVRCPTNFRSQCAAGQRFSALLWVRRPKGQAPCLEGDSFQPIFGNEGN